MESYLKPIRLDDKEKICEIRRRYGHETSSHCFQSLYIWKDDMKLSVCIEDDLFAVKSGLERDNEWFFPCGDPEKIGTFLKQLDREGLSIKYSFWR